MPCDVWSSLASEAAVDLMNPVGAGGRTVGGGRKAGLDKGGSTQHAAYLGGGREESNRNEIPARRIDMSGAPRLPVNHLGDSGCLFEPAKFCQVRYGNRSRPWLIFAWWLGPPLAVLLAVLCLWKMLAPLMR